MEGTCIAHTGEGRCGKPAVELFNDRVGGPACKVHSEAELFTCKDCSGHELVVIHEYALTTSYTASVECTCGDAEDGLAAERSYHITETVDVRGILNEDHRMEDEERDTLDTEEEEDDYQVNCAECLQEAEESDWEIEAGEPEEDDHEFRVECTGCGREIEFAWSHPDRGGRIWPADCIDFNPWKGWPEPRYRESWEAKGWLRPD